MLPRQNGRPRFAFASRSVSCRPRLSRRALLSTALSCTPRSLAARSVASGLRSTYVLRRQPPSPPAPSAWPASAWARPSRRLPSAFGAPVDERHADKLHVTVRPPQLKPRRFPTSPDPPTSIPPPGARCLANMADRGPKHESDPRLGLLSRRASAASRSRPRRDPGEPRLGIHVA